MTGNLLISERRTTLLGALAGMVLVIIVGLIFLLPLGDGLTRWSYDLPFLCSSRNVPDEVVMVYLDPRIKSNLGQSTSEPLPRRFYTQLLERLTADGARLVLFDILFDEPSKDPAVDADFAAAIRRHGHVVLVGYMLKEFQGNTVSTIAMPPIPALESSTAGWGLAEISQDPADQEVRILNTGNDTIPSVSWVAATVLNAPVTKSPASRLDPRWLNYYCEPTAFKSVNLDKALETNGLAPGYFKNKIVIVGNLPHGGGISGAQLEEFPTPYTRLGGPMAAGAAVHAFSLVNLLRSDWLSRMGFAKESALTCLWAILVSLTLIRFRPWVAAPIAVAGVCLFGLIAIWLQAKEHLWFSWLVPAGAQTSVALLWSLGFQYAVEARRRKKLRRAFAAYLSPHLADRIAESRFELALGGKEVEATIMFTDLEGFTSMAESLPPAEVSRILTSYFNETTQHILDEEGTIIKYLGDSVMAAWGAPLDQPRPASRAVLAALGMQRASRKEIAGHILRTRFGINTGLVLAGNLGSDFRFDYTLVGQAANIASRLEGLNKYLGTEILISGSVQRELEPQILVRGVGSFIVVGAKQPVPVYEVLGFQADFQPPPTWLDTFAKGLEHYSKRELDQAEGLFRKVIEQRGGKDGPSSFYLETIAEVRSKPDADKAWDGHIRLTSK